MSKYSYNIYLGRNGGFYYRLLYFTENHLNHREVIYTVACGGVHESHYNEVAFVDLQVGDLYTFFFLCAYDQTYSNTSLFCGVRFLFENNHAVSPLFVQAQKIAASGRNHK